MVTGIVSGDTGSVPGPPEGFRGSTGGVHLPRGAYWAEYGWEPAHLVGWCATPSRAHAPRAANPKGWGRLHLAWRPSHLPGRLPLPQIGSGGCRQPPRGTLGRSPLSPQPINRGEEGGQPHTSPWRSPSPSLHLLSSAVLIEALPEYHVAPPSPRRRAAGALPQPLLPPCWIKA